MKPWQKLVPWNGEKTLLEISHNIVGCICILAVTEWIGPCSTWFQAQSEECIIHIGGNRSTTENQGYDFQNSLLISKILRILKEYLKGTIISFFFKKSTLMMTQMAKVISTCLRGWQNFKRCLTPTIKDVPMI